MFVIAFDPGLTTGYTILEYGTGGFLPSSGFRLVDSGEIIWQLRIEAVRSLFWNGPFEPLQVGAVVIENFKLYAHKATHQIGSDFPSAQVIGIIHSVCYDWGLLDLCTFQMASDISRVQVRPEHQVHLLSEHMRDSYKHARLWLVKKGIEVPI